MRVVHFIVKEESWFSSMLMASSIRSVIPVIDKFVLIDNGCSEDACSMYLKELDEAKSNGVEIVIDKVKGRNFSKLRNKALSHSKPGDLILKLDADDVHYQKGLDEVFSYMESDENVGIVLAEFYHHRRDPSQYQTLHLKDIFYKQTDKMKWVKPVHESLEGSSGEKVHSDYKYHHFGYCKSRYELLSHWINYDILEFGEIKRYDMSSIETLDPDKNLHGQFDPESNIQYDGEFPPEVSWMFDGTLENHGLEWTSTGLEGEEFNHLEKYFNVERT